MTEIETRSLITTDVQVRSDENGKRILTGIAVPYGQAINVGGFKESFERGAFGEFKPVQLFYNHNSNHLPIGMVTRGEDTETGYQIEAKLSNTRDANDVYELLKDNVLSTLSIGFAPVQHRSEKGVTVRTAVDLREVSVVNKPAYADAKISEVRSDSDGNDNPQTESQKMTDYVTSADFTELRNEVKDEIRSLATTSNTTTAPVTKFSSMGDYLKRGLAGGEATSEDREVLVRAFAGGATAGDVVADAAPGFVPSWIDRDVKLMAQSRNILDLFSKQPLPASGMSVTYPIFGSATGDVALQAAEADNLSLIKLTLGNASAPVKTYGAYSDLSRQVIEREPVSYLNKVLDYQKLSYAKITNGVVRTALQAVTGYNAVTLLSADNTKGVTWTNAALAARAAIQNNSYGCIPAAWVVSFAQFQTLASITDTTNGRPVFDINGDGSNTFGTTDLAGISARVGGLPVVVDFGLSGAYSYVVSTDALTVLEDGAKFLDDVNNVNLTKQFSVFGYLALTVNDPKGIARIDHT